MRGLMTAVALALTLASTPLQGGELRAGAGLFFLAEDGVDLLVSYRPEHSRFEWGYRYVRWTDQFNDPFTGRKLTTTTSTLTGPVATFFFSPESRHHAYLGLSVLRWSKSEHSLVTDEVGTGSTTALFFGGGYTGAIGKSLFYNAGFFIAPGAKVTTSTSVSSEEDSGGFDIRLQIGLAL
jgi:hypothetical protein